MIYKVEGSKIEVPSWGKGVFSYFRKGKKRREPCFMQILEDEVQPGMSVFEIGANVGYQTMRIAKSLNGSGMIYAFEPDDRNMKYLKKNIEHNNVGNIVKTYGIALSDIDGKTGFFISSDKTNLNSLIKTKNAKSKKTVKSRTLDSFCSEASIYPDFIKMDIEGGEVKVLDNADKVLENGVRILMEVHPDLYSDETNFYNTLSMIFSKGYRAKYVVSATLKQPEFFRKNNLNCIDNSPPNVRRGIFKNVPNDIVIEAVCGGIKELCPKKNKKGKIVRSIYLVPNNVQ